MALVAKIDVKGNIEYHEEDLPDFSTSPSKSDLLASITVTTQSGKTFHGDEESQGRIARALQIAGFTGQTQTGWKLTDGNTHIVTVEELQEALTLAMIEVGRIVGAIE